MNRTEAEKMYQAAVRCVGEGGSVRGGPAEILRACNRTREQFDRDAAAHKAKIEAGKIAPMQIKAIPAPRSCKPSNPFRFPSTAARAARSV